MLDRLADMAAIFFNMISAIAIVATGYWFIRRGQFDSFLDISDELTRVSIRPDGAIYRFTIDLKNIGATKVKVAQIVVFVDWLAADEIDLGPVENGVSPKSPAINLLKDYFTTVPGASSPVHAFIKAKPGTDFCRIRWYLFYAMPFTNPKNIEDVQRLARRNRDKYYFDTTVFPLVQEGSLKGGRTTLSV